MTQQPSLEFFRAAIQAGIPQDHLPKAKPYDATISHAPKRKVDAYDNEEYHTKWSDADTQLALRNALRYIPKALHEELLPELLEELRTYGHIYMYRYRPDYEIFARPIDAYPAQSRAAASIMLMIDNNLDHANAQHPHELVTYGGNGAVFQNWAQYRLTMQYLSQMTDEQTLVMYSGHPLGLFPASMESPRVVVTNGMMIPNHSQSDDLHRYNALGVSQYGQMTAGSYMYIGSQGIVHGTLITVLNAGRLKGLDSMRGHLFVTSGLGGMSGAQGKAAKIAGAVGIVAEIDAIAAHKRHKHGWVDEVYDDLDALLARTREALAAKEAVALAFCGNIVNLWERIVEEKIDVALGSDQTSLHNPFDGGYYPADLTFEEGKHLMETNPVEFRKQVADTLRRHVNAINTLSAKGMYFFDYGNAFLKCARDIAHADILKADGSFKYPSYVEDIMGPMCFDYGFGPFRWVCCSGTDEDLLTTDAIAAEVIKQMQKEAPKEIQQQLADNLHWIETADENKLVVGSKARILYADSEGRMRIALAFNEAIQNGRLSAPIVLGRDHHDVSGTDSPYRETSNIRDGSRFTADMAVHNVIGDAMRGATWVSIHNGGGVGWGEVMNGGFGMYIDGSDEAARRIESMLFWDVNNGISRRSWARNPHAMSTIQRTMDAYPSLQVTMPELVDDDLLNDVKL